MSNRVKMIFFLFLLLPVLSFSALPQNDAPKILSFVVIQNQFPFSRATVQSAIIEMRNGTYQGLHVKLKPSVAKEFERITTLGQGRVASFILNGKVISSAIIGSTMSGDLRLMLPRADAEIFLRQLADKSLDAPYSQPTQAIQPPEPTPLPSPPLPQPIENSDIIED